MTNNFQESFYNDTIDYRKGSPHLVHFHLYDKLVRTILAEVHHLAELEMPLKILEIGAGHGGYTEPVLAAGCEVTAVEMSRPSLTNLEGRFGHNERFKGVYDPEARMEGLEGSYSLILCVSVLHHIPDYIGTIRSLTMRLKPGGSIVTLQDPLWYDRISKRALRLNQLGFAIWRIRQGNISVGAQNRLRRLRKGYDETNPADMVEYHVVRNGVDEGAIVDELKNSFESLKLLPYWSNQSLHFQRLGERIRLANTFGVIGRGYTK